MKLVKPQPEKASFSMVVTVLGMESSVREVQTSKVSSAMTVIPFGMEKLVKAQLRKAEAPMEVTLSGMVMSVSSSQS